MAPVEPQQGEEGILRSGCGLPPSLALSLVAIGEIGQAKNGGRKYHNNKPTNMRMPLESTTHPNNIDKLRIIVQYLEQQVRLSCC